ncbi:hypothetical protein ACIBCN_36560 [Nocardia sp. NPDC051052]|uniref:P-loop NTPase n=1 Tax=Nocardia sp. NPDC051052 TaxID=3364322 RepID=UPI00378DBF05
MTGAGFSHGAVDRNGHPIPLGRELAEQIWPIAFGDSTFDRSSNLGEVFRLANRKSGTLLRNHLELVLSVDSENIPRRYYDWFSLPWHRIYTLNIDDLDRAVSMTLKSPRALRILSAFTSTPGDAASRDHLAVVHLNGRMVDFPNLTFDPPSYGARTSLPDAWYQQFVTDIVTRPTFFIGTVLDEPPFWHYLSQRGSKGATAETRPRSWLITRNLPAARRELLSEFNIYLVEQYEEEFYTEFISPNVGELKQIAKARKALANTEEESYLVDVAGVIASGPKGDANFLLGREPTWGDVHDGFAAQFDWDAEVIEDLRTMSDGTYIVHGGSGTGKSTTMLRAAAVLAADGNRVLWVSRDTDKSPSEIRAGILDRQPDYVFIDNLDRFGDTGPSFMDSLMNKLDTTVFVGAMRTQRLYRLELPTRLTAKFKPAPHLSDSDAIRLIAALSKGNRLGALLQLTASDRVDAITRRAGRQLLVSLIEATSGRKFHDKVADECRNLTGMELAAYGVACCADSADGQYLTSSDILIAIGAANNEGVKAVRALTRDGLLTDTRGKLRVRHRVIAESAVNYFRSEDRLQEWMEHLIFLCAVKYTPSAMTRGRYGRLLIRFLNHDFLKEQLGSVIAVQTLYGSVETILSNEFHYWLQRGSFEVEVGDLGQAETFLLQAQALKPDDFFLETEWCYLLLKRALYAPNSATSTPDAEDALRRLEALMTAKSEQSPHTYHVYLNLGLKWLLAAPLSVGEARLLRDNLRRYAVIAKSQFRSSNMINGVVSQVERRLMTLSLEQYENK